MLLKTHLIPSPAVDRLVQAWTVLYSLDFSALSLVNQPALYVELLAANSPDGRALTRQKLNETLLRLQAEVAGVQTSDLYAYLENVMNPREIRQVAETSCRVYQKLLELYAEDALDLAKLISPGQSAGGKRSQQTRSQQTQSQQTRETAAIVTFAQTLEPLMLEFQRLHQQSADWRSLGFLTTQFNFANVRLSHSLTECEQVLIQPYLRFVEEQVAHPWQRVCAAAVTHSLNSLPVAAVEQIMLMSHSVATATYYRLLELCPAHSSRRGSLASAQIKHSCVRDLKMFQSYLCLCILQGSIQPVEDELLDLCVRVMPSVGVQWSLTALWTQTLTQELLPHLDPQQQQTVLPYATQMHQVFSGARSKFEGSRSQSAVTPSAEAFN